MSNFFKGLLTRKQNFLLKVTFRTMGYYNATSHSTSFPQTSHTKIADSGVDNLKRKTRTVLECYCILVRYESVYLCDRTAVYGIVRAAVGEVLYHLSDYRPPCLATAVTMPDFCGNAGSLRVKESNLQAAPSG